MSENQKTDRIFADGLWLQQKLFPDGGGVLKMSIRVDKFIEFLAKNKNETGFVNLVIREKQEHDEKSTHYCYIDSWKPTIPKKAPSTPK
jgi:hypothetical protein